MAECQNQFIKDLTMDFCDGERTEGMERGREREREGGGLRGWREGMERGREREED